jgi:basic membrane protein A
VGDGGWSYAHDLGRQHLERELPYVATSYVEAVAEGKDAEQVFCDLAEDGYDVIFATSFGYMDTLIEIAPDYPETIFLHATGYKTAENVGIYDGRGYQGWYLAGLVAGRMTETDVVGYIAPFAIPEVIRNLNAFTLGVREINPEATVRIEWIDTWFDPPREQAAAQSLIDLGADVIARESDSTAPDQLAQQQGVYAVGYNSDSRAVAPQAVLTAPVWHWGIYYTQVVEAIHDGTWENVAYWGSMGEGILELAPFGPMVPADVQQVVAEKEAAIVGGEWDVFTGPIYDQGNILRVPAGERMSDEALLSFDWLVWGTVGSISTE